VNSSYGTGVGVAVLPDILVKVVWKGLLDLTGDS
jgi:hypothetical protein